MKVLLLSGSSSRNSGGLYNSVRNLGQALLKIKDTDALLLAHNDDKSETDLPAYYPFKVAPYKLTGPSKLGYSSDLKKIITEQNPDILHPQCLWMYLSYVNLHYTKKYHKPYIISPRGMLDKWILSKGKLQKKIALMLYEKEHLQNASCIHALSISEYNSIRTFGCKNPVAIIPNGVNLPAENQNNNLLEWEYHDGRKNLLFLSRIHPKKNLENLLTAWSEVKNKKSWKLIIAGESADQSYLQSLQALQKKLELENDVLFVGPKFHEEKDICFRAADAFILPSFSEGLPMAVLEAWSYKLPILITEECNLPEGLTKNAAIKIKTEKEDIALQLGNFFDMNDDERKQMGLNGFELVKEKFIWDSVAAKMHEVYEWILNGGKAPSTIMFE